MQGATLLAQCVCSATAMPWWPARRHVGACLLSGLPKQCSLSPDATCSPLPAFLPLSSICPPLPFSSRPFGSAHAGSVENAAKAFLAVACYLTVRRHARSLQGRVVDFLLLPRPPGHPESPHLTSSASFSYFSFPDARSVGGPVQVTPTTVPFPKQPALPAPKSRKQKPRGRRGDSQFRGIIPSFQK